MVTLFITKDTKEQVGSTSKSRYDLSWKTEMMFIYQDIKAVQMSIPIGED